MAFSFKKFLAGIKLVPKTASTADSKGDLEVIDSTGKLGFHNGTTVSPVVTESHSAALTNKTIDADSNTITNIENADIKAAAAIDASKIADGSVSNTEFQFISTVTSNVQDQIDSKATATGLSDHINDTVDAHDASAISVSAISGLTATEVQAALAEHQVEIENVVSDLGAHILDTVDAHDASAISNIPSGNLAATDIQGAVDELQSDIDTRATASALSGHTGASSGVHGVVGSVVGTTDSQVLTNKTITGADIRTPVRSDVKQDTKANLTTYALTASNGQLVFATDTKEMFQVVDTLLEAVGGGAGIGGVDILFSQTFEEAAITDFTQTGLSLSTSSPIHGAISALMTHQAVANQSFKQVIAVDEKFRGQAMLLELNVKSTASAGNVTLNVYDETNAANIVASEQLTLSSATGGIKVFSAFTIPATCLSLSYTITALPEAGSPVTRIDDILCQLNNASLLETSVTVPNITAWQSYTPTFTGFGTPSAIEMEWRQVGENVEIRGKFASGTTTAVEARVGLPAGLTSAGTSLIPSVQVVGTAGRSANSAQSIYNVNIEPSVNYVTFGFQGSSSSALSKVNATVLVGAAESLSLFASVPVLGLTATSDVAIPLTQSGIVQEADGNLQVNGFLPANGSTNTCIMTLGSGTIVKNIGNHITWVASATLGDTFTATKDGTYSLNFSADTGTVVKNLGFSKNSTQLTTSVQSINTADKLIVTVDSGTNNVMNYSWTGPLVAGDVVRVHNDTGAFTSASTSYSTLSITHQGSLKQVTVNTNSKITIPTSELRFEGASARGTGGEASTIQWTTLAKIRGDAFSVSNTNGTLITMTKAGRISVSASAASSVSTSLFTVFKNSENKATTQAFTGTGTVSISPSFDVAVGDVVKVTMSNTPTSSSNNILEVVFQEQDIQVSVSNTLPQFSESDSSVRVDTANGYGSTATKIRRFSNVRDNIGTDVEYTDSATNGASFRVMSDGVYNVSYSDNSVTASAIFGISKNSSSLTTDVQSLAASELLAIQQVDGTQDARALASWSGYLVAGDIIRPHATAGAIGSAANTTFTISKVGKPNVTGVDVTPFVNVPQPVRQNVEMSGNGFASTSTAVFRFTPRKDTVNGIIATTDSATGGTFFTALRRCEVNISLGGPFSTVSANNLFIVKNGTGTITASTPASASTLASATASVSLRASISAAIVLEAGENIYVHRDSVNVSGNDALSILTIVAESLSDTILTAPETFSTDTAALAYAGSGTYTLSTLANAPVGTYITFTYAASTNTRTQTTGRPTQTDADMNANGILLYTRAYNAFNNSTIPPVFAIQIGKGMKGKSIDLYKSAGKVNAGSLDSVVYSTAGELGAAFKEYNEVTGILLVDAGFMALPTNTSHSFQFVDTTIQTSGYLVINASKNPALTGLGIDRVAARGVNTAGTSIANSTATTLVYDSTKTYDTHGALNTATGIFTAPVSGYYLVDSVMQFIGLSWTLGQFLSLSITKNGTTTKSNIVVTATTGQNYGVVISDVVYLAKGDTASSVAFHNRGAASALNTNTGSVVTSFNKISGIN